MKIDFRDLQNLLQGVHIHVHIHSEHDGESESVDELRRLIGLLSHSRLKLQHAIDSLQVPEVSNTIAAAARSTALRPEDTHLKNPLDIAIQELKAEVTAVKSASDAATILITAIPGMIDKAVKRALALGATPAQLGEITAVSELLKTEAAELGAAVAANTIPESDITLSPTSGFDGTSLTISGEGFGVSQGSGRVTVDGNNATITSWSDTSIIATIPLGSSTGPADRVVDVAVSTTAGDSFTAQFTVTPDPNV